MNFAAVPLADLASPKQYAFVGGPFGSKLTSADYVAEGIPVIRGANLSAGRFLNERDFVFVSEQKMREDLFGNLAHPGDIVFTQRGTLGQVSIIPENARFDAYVISQSQMKLSVDFSKADVRFLYYWFSSSQTVEKIISQNSSSGVPHINLTVLRNFKVPVPPLREQHRIAGILSAYDDLIENNRRRIALLEQASRMLYREWFVHFRFPGHEHIKIIDGLPEGWEAQAASVAFEVNPSTPRNGDQEILYVPMAALSESAMTIDRSPLELRAKSTNVRFRNSDTLFARITPCLENGKTGFVYFLQDNEVACGSTEFIVLRGRSVSPYFVYLTSRMESFRQNAIKSMIGASGRQRVQDSCFDRYRLAIPPKLLASIFDETVGPMFEQISKLDQAEPETRPSPRPAASAPDEWGDRGMMPSGKAAMTWR